MKSKTPDRTDGESVEFIMKSIELLAEKLENQDTSLDGALEAFEEGIKLVHSAQKSLHDAGKRIKLLQEQEGQAITQSFTTRQDIE